MAWYNRRRYPRTRVPRARSQLNTVRIHQYLELDTSNNVRWIDLLEPAQADPNAYRKDLTPSSIVGVRGHYTWSTPAATATASAGFLGVGLIVKSTAEASTNTTEAQESVLSPLHVRGRYQHWHYRSISFVSEQTGTGHEVSQQFADNKVGIRPKSRRRLPTVDDSYYLCVDWDLLEETVTFAYELTIFLRQ